MGAHAVHLGDVIWTVPHAVCRLFAAHEQAYLVGCSQDLAASIAKSEMPCSAL